jgi:outer membrane receptor protein involved in Fe transport
LAAVTTISAGRLALTGTVQRELSDGYVPVRGPRAGAADVPLDLATLSGGIRADVALNDATALSLRGSAYQEDRGAGLRGARSSATGQSYSATLSHAPSAGRPGWRAQVWRRESDLANSAVAVAVDRATITPANSQFATPAEGWGTNLAVRRSAVQMGGGVLEWELGADARFTKGETQELFRYVAGAFTRDRVAGGRTSVIGAYGEGSWTAGPWLVAVGLRVDGWTNSDGRRLERDRATGLATLDDASPDRSGEVVSARLAVRRALASGFAARAAAYSGFRPATLNELHRPFRVGNDLTEANAGLIPETLRGLETGLSWQGADAALTATAFWNRIEDAIVNVTIGAGPGTFPRAGFVPAGGVLRQRQNAGTIEATGLELTAEYRLADTLSLDAALSVTDAEVDGGAAAPRLTGLRPAQAPVRSASAGADWRVSDRLTLILRARYESRRFEDDLNSRVLDGAVTADARVEWSVREGITVYAAADNLFDTRVAVAEGGDGVEGYGPPRTLRAGLSLSW